MSAVSREFTLEELAGAVQRWCEEHQIWPVNGQAAEQITERNIRYYRTLGLLDPPLGSYNKTFGEKHRLQLVAIRVYQAQGLPLRKIRDELYGKSLEDLVALEKQVSKRGKQAIGLHALPSMPIAGESWSVVALGGDYLLVSRQNKALPRGVIEEISRVLMSAHSGSEDVTSRN